MMFVCALYQNEYNIICNIVQCHTYKHNNEIDENLNFLLQYINAATLQFFFSYNVQQKQYEKFICIVTMLIYVIFFVL